MHDEVHTHAHIHIHTSWTGMQKNGVRVTVDSSGMSQLFMSIYCCSIGAHFSTLLDDCCFPNTCRALRDTLMPKSGPSQSKVHKIHAAWVMRAFDLEHLDSGILDTDMVLVRYTRRAYIMESSFLAGELRQCDRANEIGLLATALSKNTSVTSGTLEPVPEACDVEGPATARDLLHPGVVRAKRTRVLPVGPRTITCDDGSSWLPPATITCTERKFVQGACRRLKVFIELAKGSCQVNGRTIRRSITMQSQSPDITISKRNILAMRSVGCWVRYIVAFAGGCFCRHAQFNNSNK